MAEATPRTLYKWRMGLTILGVALLLLGGYVLLDEVNPKRYIGILTWFAGAIILHDGIVAPAVFVVTFALRKYARRVPFVIVAIVEGAVVIGGIITLIVVPEVLKKQIGTLSSSILPQDYALHLVVFYGVLVILTAVAIGGYLRVFTRRAKLLSSADQA